MGLDARLGHEMAAAATAELNTALGRLRDETGTPWTAQQDAVTGYAAILDGGTYGAGGEDPATLGRSFLDAHGALLAAGGVGGRLADAEVRVDGAGLATLVYTQVIAGAPVFGGQVRVHLDAAGRITRASGRVYPVPADPASAPSLTPDDALAQVPLVLPDALVIARPGNPSLTWFPTGAGVTLAYRVGIDVPDPITGQHVNAYLTLDALTGTPVSLDIASVAFQTPVTGTGTDSSGAEQQVNLTQAADGTFEAVDRSRAMYDAATDSGVIAVADAASGATASFPSATVTDPAVVEGLQFLGVVYEYYRQVHGLDSYDGNGADVIAFVHEARIECNAFWSSVEAAMRFGDCGGAPMTGGLDLVGHEMTHGVTAAVGGDLVYQGEPGALNESISDYFGNAIQDWSGAGDSPLVGETLCDVTPACVEYPHGTALRDMDVGATIENLLYLLGNDPFNDSGGVHLNSVIPNEALWDFRTAMRGIGGAEGALRADRVVFRASTVYTLPSTDFLGFRSAMEAAAEDLALNEQDLAALAAAWDGVDVCAGCGAPAATGHFLTMNPGPQLRPQIRGSKVVWADLRNGGLQYQVAMRDVETDEFTNVSGERFGLSAAFHGDRIAFVSPGTLTLATLPRGTVVLFDPATGAYEELPGTAESLQVAADDAGIAWVRAGPEALILEYRDATGAVTQIGEGTVLWPAVYSGTVAWVDLDRGEVWAWSAGAGARPVATLPAPPADMPAWTVDFQLALRVGGLDMHGPRAVLTAPNADGFADVIVVDVNTGTVTTPSHTASPYGAAIDGNLVVWAEVTGGVTNPYSRGMRFADTDLWGYRIDTARTYELAEFRGQQGYPDLYGTQLVWQEATLGGDDIATADLPAELVG